MKKIAIMQPYIFPYIGYFQLINAVDLFVFYNDVNFIKRGWINRNRILLNGKDHMITIPCAEVSQHKRICDTAIALSEKEREKLLLTVRQAYKKAPFFAVVYPLIENVFKQGYAFIDQLAIESIKGVCQYLGIETKFIESNGRYGNESLKLGDRLIDIALKEGYTRYVNPIGGRDIYSKEIFMERGVCLYFLNPKAVTYDQFNNEFTPWLSVIDVLMFNEKEKVASYLNNYELV